MVCYFDFMQEVIGVVLGGTLGHALCTGLAVLGGRFIAQRISARTGNASCLNITFKNVVIYAFFQNL